MSARNQEIASRLAKAADIEYGANVSGTGDPEFGLPTFGESDRQPEKVELDTVVHPDGRMSQEKRTFWVARISRVYPLHILIILLAAPIAVGVVALTDAGNRPIWLAGIIFRIVQDYLALKAGPC